MSPWAGTVDEAYRKALASDPVSAFGGVVVVNRPIEGDVAATIAEQFIEVLMAPAYSDDSVETLQARESIRILVNEERRRQTPGERDFRRVMGGMLVQDIDSDIDDRETRDVAVGITPTEAQWGDLLFAWHVAKYVASNAIVLVKDLATVGIGGGQMSPR